MKTFGFGRASAVAGLLVASVASSGVAAEAAGPALCQTNCATAIAAPVTAGAQPFSVTGGPRGSMWFSLDTGVGRIDQRGQFTSYFVRSGAGVGWTTTNPADGTVWFAERGAGRVGRITPAGSITEYLLPKSFAVPQGIVFAPDGNVYVTEQGANAIARLNPVTGQATDIPVPTPNSTTQSGALGPDGAIWFIERSAAKVGRLSLAGTYTEYPLAPGSFPNRIVSGPDGALWFTELIANKIGRITTDGQLTEYPVPGAPVGIAVGKDGQLYVVLFRAAGVDRIDLTGHVTGHWALPGAVGPLLLATGSGLDIWVADAFGRQLYRLTPYDVGR